MHFHCGKSGCRQVRHGKPMAVSPLFSCKIWQIGQLLNHNRVCKIGYPVIKTRCPMARSYSPFVLWWSNGYPKRHPHPAQLRAVLNPSARNASAKQRGSSWKMGSGRPSQRPWPFSKRPSMAEPRRITVLSRATHKNTRFMLRQAPTTSPNKTCTFCSKGFFSLGILGSICKKSHRSLQGYSLPKRTQGGVQPLDFISFQFQVKPVDFIFGRLGFSFPHFFATICFIWCFTYPSSAACIIIFVLMFQICTYARHFHTYIYIYIYIYSYIFNHVYTYACVVLDWYRNANISRIDVYYNARLDIEIVSCYAMGWVLRYCNVCMCMHLCVMLKCILLYYICMAFGICIWHMAP